MQGYLRLKESNCKNCYKCIRHCPVKSIKFSGNQAHIVEDECILCGMCFMVCPQNAKEIRSDVGRAKELIASGAPVYASIAPSFVANYDDATIKSMEKALKILGFAGAEETAIGATIVKTRYEQMLREGAQDIVISTCCHSVNTPVSYTHLCLGAERYQDVFIFPRGFRPTELEQAFLEQVVAVRREIAQAGQA